MSGRPRQQELVPDPAALDGTVAINARCSVRTLDGHCVVLVAGVVVAQFAAGDRMAEAHARVGLVDQGWAEQREVALAFGCSTRTVRRDQRRFEEGGLSALGRQGGYPRGLARVEQRRSQQVFRLKASGQSNREIARRLGVSEKAIRKQARSLGFRPRSAEQGDLPLGDAGADPKVSALAAGPAELPGASTASGADPNLSAPVEVPGEVPAAAVPSPADPNLSAPVDPDAALGDTEPLPESLDTDPADRRVDRLMACLGLLSDAAPLFRDGQRVPRAGVLLAIPALLDSGLLDEARAVYGNIAPAFYGLRTTLVALLLMALLRIKRPEALKEHSPPDLGRLLGLDRAPEVKTLRRKLARLAGLGRATELGRALARRRVAAQGQSLGFLYVDGHVRVYHGQREIPKAHVARMRIALPATTDYWVNDHRGDPLFVVTAEANAGLVKILPGLLAEMRGLVGARRLTIVFDRGGWSPALFQSILEGGFDILTYRKGKKRLLPKRRFTEHAATLDGQVVRYHLADQRVRLRGCAPLLRQVTRRSDDGHQTEIITSRMDLRAVEVAFRMFGRWTQENFFKYLREEYALDALIDYATEADDPDREVPNPCWAAVDAELRAARARLDEVKRTVGVDTLRDVMAAQKRRTRSRLSDAVARSLADAITRVLLLERRRAAVPRRIPVAQRTDGMVIKLATERKHLSNLLKMVAYQAEGDLVRLVAPHYRRADEEGRTLVQTALACAADVHVTDEELRITLAPLSSDHRTAAVAALCRQLDQRAVRFPGSRLRLRYAIADAA
jgi:transposase